MPANVDSAVYANTPAWHREGIVLDTNGEKGLTIAQALPASGLEWEVKKIPIFGYSAYVYDEFGNMTDEPTPDATVIRIDDRYGVQRDSDQKILGVVGNIWTPVQNHEGFQIVDELLQGSGTYIEAAGALDGGKQVWVLAHCPSDLQIGGESIAEYILFTNGHDGRTSVTAAITPVRVVCQNTLTWALATVEGGRVVRVRHTTKAADRIAEAKRILGLRNLWAEELAKQGEWLVDQKMDDAAFDRFLKELMPIAEEQEEKPAGTMIRKRRSGVLTTYRNAENLNNIRGTRWGALNAVVEYSDYGIERQGVDTAMKAQIAIATNASTIKDRALQLLTA